jgi:hypothetical protein
MAEGRDAGSPRPPPGGPGVSPVHIYSWDESMRDEIFPICPLPGLGHCVRERCNFWDEAQEVCTADCCDALDPEAGAASHPGGGCILSFYEDFD